MRRSDDSSFGRAGAAFRSASRPRLWIVWILLTGQALAVFCFDIGADSLRADEFSTWDATFQQGGLQGPLTNSAARHNHPPLYYVLLWCWGAALGAALDTTEVLLRLPSALFMAACVSILYKLARAAGGPWAAFFGCQFFIFSPVAIHYAQEARPYALYCLLSLVSLAALLSILQSRHARTPERDYAAYGVALFATCLTHPYAVFVAAAHVVVVGFFGAGRRRAFALAWLATLIGLLPVIAGFVADSKRMSGFLFDPERNLLWTDPGLGDFLKLPFWLVFGGRTWASATAAALAGLALLLALSKLVAETLPFRDGRRIVAKKVTLVPERLAPTTVYVLATLVLPTMVTVLWTNIFWRNYFIASMPAVILLGVAVLYRGVGRPVGADPPSVRAPRVSRARRACRVHVLCGILLALMIAGAARFHATERGTQWREAIDFVAKDLAEHDAVVLDGDLVGGRANVTLAWTYYHRRLATTPHEHLWFWRRQPPAPLRARLRDATVRGLRSREPGRVWILKGVGGKWDYPPDLREVLNHYRIDLVASFMRVRVYLGVRESSAQTSP